MVTSKVKKSGVLRKITLGASASLMAVALVTAVSSETLAEEESSGGGGSGWFWESKYIPCTVTITYGGGPFPYSVAETYAGQKRICVDGWSLCLTGFCSA